VTAFTGSVPVDNETIVYRRASSPPAHLQGTDTAEQRKES
jgi:hypothetical protein